MREEPLRFLLAALEREHPLRVEPQGLAGFPRDRIRRVLREADERESFPSQRPRAFQQEVGDRGLLHDDADFFDNHHLRHHCVADVRVVQHVDEPVDRHGLRERGRPLRRRAEVAEEVGRTRIGGRHRRDHRRRETEAHPRRRRREQYVELADDGGARLDRQGGFQMLDRLAQAAVRKARQNDTRAERGIEEEGPYELRRDAPLQVDGDGVELMDAVQHEIAVFVSAHVACRVRAQSREERRRHPLRQREEVERRHGVRGHVKDAKPGGECLALFLGPIKILCRDVLRLEKVRLALRVDEL